MANDSRQRVYAVKGDRGILFGIVSNFSNFHVYESIKDNPIINRSADPNPWWSDYVEE